MFGYFLKDSSLRFKSSSSRNLPILFGLSFLGSDASISIRTPVCPFGHLWASSDAYGPSRSYPGPSSLFFFSPLHIRPNGGFFRGSDKYYSVSVGIATLTNINFGVNLNIITIFCCDPLHGGPWPEITTTFLGRILSWPSENFVILYRSSKFLDFNSLIFSLLTIVVLFVLFFPY